MPPSARAPLWFLFANMLVVLAAFWLGTRMARLPALPEPQQTALHLVHQEILRSHVDAQDPQELLDRAIGAMVRSLDDYSQYVPPSQVARFVEATTGNYQGIGVVVHWQRDSGRMFVRFPFADSPGERAGLQPGDEIVAVAGARLDALDGAARERLVDERIRGPSGTTVELTVAPRAGGAERTVSIERAAVRKSTVKWVQHLAPKLGYACLSDFHPGSAAELREALQQLAAADGGLAGLILDLRWNGGGNLDECLSIARMFLSQGNILTVRRRGTEVVQSYDADASQCTWPELPLVVLVNQGSASASEVFAGALQDHGRAVLVGVRTFGKGMINTVTTYRLGFRLKLTTGRYFTPHGRSIEGHHGNASGNDRTSGTKGGIAPDHEVPVPEPDLLRLRQALEGHEPPPRHRAAEREFAAEQGIPAAGILPPAQDPQLAAALAELQRQAHYGGRAK